MLNAPLPGDQSETQTRHRPALLSCRRRVPFQENEADHDLCLRAPPSNIRLRRRFGRVSSGRRVKGLCERVDAQSHEGSAGPPRQIAAGRRAPPLVKLPNQTGSSGQSPPPASTTNQRARSLRTNALFIRPFSRLNLDRNGGRGEALFAVRRTGSPIGAIFPPAACF
jgi:hypothetical protein